jgi:outer membrane receptor protein involved in Fe transport
MFTRCRIVVGLLLVLGAASRADAQATVDLTGYVRTTPSNRPLVGASVLLQPGDRVTRTDSTGRFLLRGVPSGTVLVEIRHPRVATVQLTRIIAAGFADTLRVEVAERPSFLPTVQVTAAEATIDGATRSRVGRAALEHLQGSSLADALQLVPGQLAENPTLSSARQVLLRQVPTVAAADRANALGTAIVVDGVPLSNNANLQSDRTILNSAPGSLPVFSSTAGRGVDLRQVPLDNIESIEVVRGIPSARFGDLTAGAVVVETRAGAAQPELRARVNPTTLELSGLAGWGDGVTSSAWRADANVTEAIDDPRLRIGAFRRATGQLAWTQPWGRGGRSTTRVVVVDALDELRPDADDTRIQRRHFARDRQWRLSTQGTWAPALGQPSRIAWTLAHLVTSQEAFTQELIGRDIFPLATAFRDTTAAVPFGRSEYLSRLQVDGRPVTTYGRLDFRQTVLGASSVHQVVAGVEGRRESNAGAGRQFDPQSPPRQNYSVGDRPRTFREVPALRLGSAYVEDRWTGRLGGVLTAIDAGVRVDVADRHDGGGRLRWMAEWQPRLNARWSLTDRTSVRLGAGRTAKAPTLDQQYPGPSFFDLASFNYYPVNPAERLAVVTTRRVDVPWGQLGFITATKREVGVEHRRGGTVLTLTAFQEQTRGAVGITRTPVPLPYPRLRASAFPVGLPPVLDPVPAAVDTFIGAYDRPVASRAVRTSGVEWTADLTASSAARTSVQVGGAWIRSLGRDDATFVDTDPLLRGAVAPTRLGVYPSGRGTIAERLVTSTRLVHRLPEAGLVVSVLWQAVWREANRVTGRSALPIAIVGRDGVVRPLSPAEAASPSLADLVRPLAPSDTAWTTRPPLSLLNVRLTKALPGRGQLAVFVNNAFADRPVHTLRREGAAQPIRERRNPPLFFGVEYVSALRVP